MNANRDACSKFKNIIYNAGFRIVSSICTRENNISQSALVLFITNVNCDTYTCTLDSGITDHNLVIGSFDISSKQSAPVKQDAKIITSTNMKEAISELQEINFDEFGFIDNLDYAFDSLGKKIKGVLQKHTVERKTLSSYEVPFSPWVTPAILVSLKKKDHLYRKWKKKKWRLDLNSKYTLYKRRLDKVLSEAKKNHFLKQLKNCAGDSKKSWRLLNQQLKNQKKGIPEDIGDLITEEGITIKNDSKKAHCANKHFTSLKDSSQIDSSQIDREPLKCRLQFGYFLSFPY